MSALGILTIGQTPRADLLEVFAAAAPGTRLELGGALDGLSSAQIDEIARPGDYPLLVRLADGTTREVPLPRLHGRVQAAAGILEARGASVIVVACTGAFPAVDARVPVILPGVVVPAVVGAVSRTRRVGVVSPNAAQVPFADRKWRDDGFDPLVMSAAPGDDAALRRAAGELAETDVALVVLDCFGHTERDRRTMERYLGRPAVAAQSIVAKVASVYV